MSRSALRITLATLLVGAALALFAACDSDGSSTSDVEPTATTSIDGDSLPGADLEPKERSFYEDRVLPATLERISAADIGPLSRTSLFFVDLIPSYRAEYVDSPIACGSGEPLDMEGEAFLQLRMTGAQGHDDSGEPTFVIPLNIADVLPAVLDVQQSCDFEGVLTLVFGLPEKLDFRIAFTTLPLRYESVVVDIKNPAS